MELQDHVWLHMWWITDKPKVNYYPNTSQVLLTLLWTRACPQGCSRRTAWRSTGGGTPYTRRHASHRWWAEARATPRRAGNCGCASGWPRTWKGRSTDALWSAGRPREQWQFAGKQKQLQYVIISSIKMIGRRESVIHTKSRRNKGSHQSSSVCQPC